MCERKKNGVDAIPFVLCLVLPLLAAILACIKRDISDSVAGS